MKLNFPNHVYQGASLWPELVVHAHDAQSIQAKAVHKSLYLNKLTRNKGRILGNAICQTTNNARYVGSMAIAIVWIVVAIDRIATCHSWACKTYHIQKSAVEIEFIRDMGLEAASILLSANKLIECDIKNRDQWRWLVCVEDHLGRH